MINIQEVSNQLNISKTQIIDTISKLTKKKYTEDTTEISQIVFNKLKKYLFGNEQEVDNKFSKLIKQEEIFNDEVKFLSSIGLESNKEELNDDNSNNNTNNNITISSNVEEEIPTEKSNYFKAKLNDENQLNKAIFTKTDKTLFNRFDNKKNKVKTNTKPVSFLSKTDIKTHKQDNNTTFAKRNQEETIEKKQPSLLTSSSLKKKEEISIGETITVKEFAEKMGIPLPEVIKKFLINKIIVSINSTIDFDTANLIGEELQVKINKVTTSISIEDLVSGNLQSILENDKNSDYFEIRPPIVTIMGHVDHGKTKLLDYIRKTDVGGKESGGITQSIGASQITHNGKKITFIDTPGHELFTSLRARGARITDIVIIVIAADEGMKQQTIEAIDHAKEANVPIIVAITKIDKGVYNSELIKGQLAEQGLTSEDWGGKIPLCPVSAISGEGVDDLLDLILLQAELIDLRYNPERMGVGVIVEAHKDTKKGVTSSLILMTGKLKVGDIVVVNDTYGRIKKMNDWKGNNIDLIYGGDPALILGIQSLPEPGRLIEVVKSEKEANNRIQLIKQKTIGKTNSIQSIISKINKGENVVLKFILKADSFGSLEALKYVCSKVEMPENIELKIIHSDVGQISESDVILAEASGAVIIGFNVESLGLARKKAETQKVQIKEFYIIYEIIDFIDKIAKGLIKIEEKEVYIGKLNILAIFFSRANEMIIGGKVVDGKIINNSFLKVIKNGVIIGNGRVTSLKKEKENVNEIGSGYECGLKVKVNKKPDIGDVLEFYVMQ